MNNSKIVFLDGIRGWACIIVLFHHLIGFLTPLTPEYQGKIYLRILTDGYFAVIVFFVLSGFAISTTYLNKNISILNITIARYFRLAIPIFLTCLLPFFLLKLQLMFNEPASKKFPFGQAWFEPFYKMDDSFMSLIKFSFYDVFFKYHGFKSWNSALWTMSRELLGSFLIYVTILMFNNKRYQITAPLIMSLLLLYIKPTLACFTIGYLIAHLYNKTIGNTYISNSKVIEFSSMLVFLYILYSLTFNRPDNDLKLCITASLLILSINYSPILKSFFSNSISKKLGEISFPLYLIHTAIICSFSAYLLLNLNKYNLSNFTISNTIVISTFLLSVMIAWLLIPMERFSILNSKKIANTFTDKLGIRR